MNRRKFLKNAIGFGAALSVPLTFSKNVFAATMPASITDFTASALSIAIREKQVSCVEVMQTYLGHINKYNPTYNAIVSMVSEEELLSQAERADLALAKNEYWGWMHGMPHAVKDLTPVKGLTYTSGSPMFADRIAEEDGELVVKIRNQGAIFIGKTNTPEFGLGSQSYNPVFGATGSAYNPALTAGGSSGGAACGLGTHMLPVADGSDMMGSLRNPGAYNNVIGFRPSTNVMNAEEPGLRALATSGPMGRNTTDAIRLLQTIALAPTFEELTPLNLNEAKIGWLGNLDNYLPMEAGILELCEANLSKVADAGGKVEVVKPRFNMTNLWKCWVVLRQNRIATMREFYDNPATKKMLKPEVIWEIEGGIGRSEIEVADAERIRNDWYAELDRLFGEYDFLVLPTAQVFPFYRELHWPKTVDGKAMDTYHRWMEAVILGSLGGLPVVNVPVGFDDKGRPMGMQVMGKFGDDRSVLKFALAYEQITDHLNKRPEMME